MAIDKNSLVKSWIQYLKNNQIVSTNSDPKTGKLNYKKSVTADMLINFLKLNTELDDKTINDAVNKVSGKKSKPAGQQGQQPQVGAKPGQQPQAPQQPQAGTKPASFSNQFSANTNYTVNGQPMPKSTTISTNKPATPEQPGSSKNTGKPSASKNKKLKEDIVDEPGPTLNEKDVEAIFDLIVSIPPKSTEKPAALSAEQPEPESEPEEASDTDQKQQDLEKLKNVIVNSMTDGQRKAFWRALNEA